MTLGTSGGGYGSGSSDLDLIVKWDRLAIPPPPVDVRSVTSECTDWIKRTVQVKSIVDESANGAVRLTIDYTDGRNDGQIKLVASDLPPHDGELRVNLKGTIHEHAK